jgi:hypothetical protein
MGGVLNVFGLGSLGVNTDKNDINLEDGELRKAQNAIHDPAGSMGGIRKRRGLTKVNSIAAAGAIRGAVGVPITKPSTRRFLAGQWTGTTGAWNTSTDAWATGGTGSGPDSYDAAADPRTPEKVTTNLANSSTRQFAFGGRPGVVYKNKFYYAGNDYTQGTTAPTVRVWDGTIDFVLTTIPYNPDIGSTTAAAAILCMIVAEDQIYISTYDGGSYAVNGVKGRVFQMDPHTGALTQMGARFPTDGARSIYAIAWHNKQLWTATFTGGISATQKVYRMRPGIDTGWTQDTASMGANGPVTEMMSFQGQLYLGAMADVGGNVLMRVRSTAGVYTTSKTVLDNEGGGTPVMASFGEWHHFGAMAVFKSNLYAVYYNRVGTGTTGDQYVRVYKYTGSAWSVVHAPAANHADAVPYQTALIHDGFLYFLSSPSINGSTGANRILKTADGTTWTSITSSQLTNNSSGALGVITS